MASTHVVIMAGGIGSRFWPMSTPEYPKQFIDVLGCGRTLIQMTVDRFRPLCPPENIWVVTSASYLDIVRQQLPEVPETNILLEPAARNTAPCIAFACWKIRLRHPDANIVVTPSDALVLDAVEYRRVISKALAFTENSDAIVTIGIKPSRPETGYGYICCSSEETSGDAEIRKVASFKEKPSLEVAESYLAAGNYLWNAGIFVWNSDTIISALRAHAPQIAGVMDEMSLSFYGPAERETVARLFPTCEKISIDYAVMEKSDNIHTIPAEFGWSDLGTWGPLRTNIEKDDDGNATVGENIHLYDCKGTVVHTSNLRHVVIDGLEDYIVAEKDGRLLICPLAQEQRIKDFEK